MNASLRRRHRRIVVPLAVITVAGLVLAVFFRPPVDTAAQIHAPIVGESLMAGSGELVLVYENDRLKVHVAQPLGAPDVLLYQCMEEIRDRDLPADARLIGPARDRVYPFEPEQGRWVVAYSLAHDEVLTSARVSQEGVR